MSLWLNEWSFKEDGNLVRAALTGDGIFVEAAKISDDTRNHFSRIYDMESGYIKTECLHQGWQTSGSVWVVRLALNLYTDGTPSIDDYGCKNEQIDECRGGFRQ